MLFKSGAGKEAGEALMGRSGKKSEISQQGGGGSATASRAIRDVLGVIYDAPDTSSDSGNSAVR